MIFHDTTQEIFLSKQKNKAEFKCLDDSEVLSSDFPDLRASAASVTSTASMALVASVTFTAIKKILILIVGSSLAPKWPIQVPFCRMYHQKSTFSLILAPFLSEAAEASQCYFFENWLMKLKCPILLKPLDTMIQENYWSFYPSEPFRITRFTMRHPVSIQVENDNGVLGRLVPCIWDKGLTCWVLQGHSGLVY